VAHSIQGLCEWLSSTPLSTEIKSIDWLIPAVQTIHILSISVVMAAAAMVNLNILGVLSADQPLAAVAHRFLPGIWWTVIILALSGITLIIGEPGRSLPNPAFLLKMSMLLTVLLLTGYLQRGLGRDGRFWSQTAPRRVGSRVIAALSLALWIGIVFAGRWIAYIDVDAL
jgi:hypothetical protein